MLYLTGIFTYLILPTFLAVSHLKFERAFLVLFTNTVMADPRASDVCLVLILIMTHLLRTHTRFLLQLPPVLCRSKTVGIRPSLFHSNIILGLEDFLSVDNWNWCRYKMCLSF